jgi:hypothetical protein
MQNWHPVTLLALPTGYTRPARTRPGARFHGLFCPSFPGPFLIFGVHGERIQQRAKRHGISRTWVVFYCQNGGEHKKDTTFNQPKVFHFVILSFLPWRQARCYPSSIRYNAGGIDVPHPPEAGRIPRLDRGILGGCMFLLALYIRQYRKLSSSYPLFVIPAIAAGWSVPTTITRTRERGQNVIYLLVGKSIFAKFLYQQRFV